VNAETGASDGDIFIKVTGKLERSDRGVQIIASSVESLELSDATNKPKVVEVVMPSSKLSRGRMEKLGTVFSRFQGMDRVEILVRTSTGDSMRMALPAMVDARNPILIEEVRTVLGREGQVVLV
jgi:DNA polymerase-3 subunit alpha